MGGEWLTPHRDLAPFLPQAVGLPSAVGSSWFVVLGGRGPPAHTHRTGLARGEAAACFEGLPGKVRWLQEKGEGRRGGFGFQWGSRQPCRALSAAGGKKEPGDPLAWGSPQPLCKNSCTQREVNLGRTGDSVRGGCCPQLQFRDAQPPGRAVHQEISVPGRRGRSLHTARAELCLLGERGCQGNGLGFFFFG